MLRVVDDVIAMHGLLWPDEIRAPEGVAPDTGVTVRDKELDLADALMDTLGEVDLADLHDDYREAVEEMITAKASGEQPAGSPAPAPSGKVLDLMAALEKSVREAKESRGAEPGGAQTAGGVRSISSRATPKQTTGKKSTSTAKKTAAKKTTAKATASGSTRGTASGSAKKSTQGTKKTAAKKTPAKKATPRKRTA